jgi:ubiquinone/menaquinone biosynthesis C-methylase UbiE
MNRALVKAHGGCARGRFARPLSANYDWAMSQTPQGHYPIERRAGEIERLHIQGAALEPDAAIMLDQIGVAPGWRCLDLGCGPGGITELMSVYAGASGQVVGLDADDVFLEHARQRARERGLANIRYAKGDAYATQLPAASFDLVHTRFLASTAGHAEELLAEMIRLTRPGGIVAFQEPDMANLNCYPPHPAWDRLRQVLAQVFPSVGGPVRLAQEIYRMLLAAGLQDVQYRPFLVGFRASHPMVDYVPSTVESIRTRIFEKGLIDASELDAALAACRAHLADPATVSTYHMMVQAWGRVPAARTH